MSSITVWTVASIPFWITGALAFVFGWSAIFVSALSPEYNFVREKIVRSRVFTIGICFVLVSLALIPLAAKIAST